MTHDPIVEEVRRVKERLAAQYGYDVRALAASLRDEQEKSARRVLRVHASQKSDV